MAFSWETEKKEEEKSPIAMSNFSWNQPKSIPEARQETFAKDSARLKLDSAYQNSLIGTLVGTFKGLDDPFVAAWRGAVEGYKSVETSDKSVKNLPENLRKSTTKAWDTWSSSVLDLTKRTFELDTALKIPEGEDGIKKEVKSASLGLGVINLFFAPIAGLMQQMSPVPVIGHATDKVEQLFAAIGGGFGAFGVDVLEGMPIDRQKKEQLKPVVEETSALIGQIAAGKAGHTTFTKVRTNTIDILEGVKSVDTQTMSGILDRYKSFEEMVPLKVEAEPTAIPVERVGSPKGERVDVKQGYDPYTPDSQLPVIKAEGRATKPKGQTGEKFFDLEIVPEKFSWHEGVPDSAKQQVRRPQSEKVVRNEPVTEKPKEPVKTEEKPAVVEEKTETKTTPKEKEGGEKFQSKTAKDFDAEAKRRGYEIEEDATWQTKRNKMDDWRRADEFVAKQRERALRVAQGKEKPPTNMLPTDIYEALELLANDLMKKGDMTLANELVKVTIGTEYAQGLQALSRGAKGNPVDIMNDVTRARREVKADEKAKAMRNAQKKTKPIKAPSPEAWRDFIRELQC